MIIFAKFIVLVVLITGCSATAPGDEDSRCVGRTYPENVKVLMDSRNYEELLPGHSADPTPDVAWTDASCDLNDTVPNPFSTPPYWQHGTGGLCAYQAQVCGYSSSGPQDNWLFTQYISKTPTAADTYTVRVYVNITYQFLSCRERGGCRSVFRLQNYITNSEQQSLTCSQTSQFSGSAIMPSNIITGSSNSETTKTLYFDMTATQDGFYFALQDIGDADLYGTCVAVSRLIIYRHKCRAQAVGLVRYPVTQAPASGTVSVTIQCVPNAQRSSSSLIVSCGSDGYWGSEHPTCECDLGYQSATNGDGNQVCNATTSVPTQSISPTPAPTASYTSLQLPVYTPIVPSPPLNLSLTENIDSAVWDPPVAPTEGIIDYDITIYRTGAMLDSVGFTRKTRGRPHYIFSKDRDIPSGIGDICVQVRAITTDGVGLWSKENCQKEPLCLTDCSSCECLETPCSSVPLSSCPALPIITKPGTVVNINVVSCNTLDWDAPANDGGEILQYRIRVYNGASYRTAVEKDTFASAVSRLALNWLPNKGPVYAIVRAINSAGLSKWSQPVTLTETGASNCSALG